MGHRILNVGYANEEKNHGGQGLKIIYSVLNTYSKVLDINAAFVYREAEGAAFKQIDVFHEGEGTENEFATKMVDFTAQGSNLVYKNEKGWNVFLLATYNQYYVAPKNQTYESFAEFEQAEDTSAEEKYNLVLKSFTKFVSAKSPASTKKCQQFYGQADSNRYAFQKEECNSCSFIYENARSQESTLSSGAPFTM